MHSSIAASLALATLMLATALPLSAQRGRTTAAQRKKAQQEALKAQQRLDMMTAATQQVTFIDSMVVDKATFLHHYRLGADAGSLHYYATFFGRAASDNATVYVNELGDKCLFAVGDSTATSIYSTDRFGDQWLAATPLPGIAGDSLVASPCYPFLMPDGTTLYFAAKGAESIGGYDIFVTRFDNESGRFLRAENIGMPFNSTANDYMYAIDEFNAIGMFATDRGQPAGKVCIYIFIPTDTRTTYSPQQYTQEQISSFARLGSIAATCTDTMAVKQACRRLQALRHEQPQQGGRQAFSFTVDHRHTYTSPSQFRHPQSLELYKRLEQTRADIARLQQSLGQARQAYSQGDHSQRASLTASILSAEQSLLSLQTEAKQMEKRLISAELSTY